MANEKRLIDANALSMEIFAVKCCLSTNGASEWTTGYRNGLEAALEQINEQTTVDAVEVVHGYWIDSYNADHMGRVAEHGVDCSVCESVFKDDSRDVVKRWKERFKVCPFCGAVMDGGNEDV